MEEPTLFPLQPDHEEIERMIAGKAAEQEERVDYEDHGRGLFPSDMTFDDRGNLVPVENNRRVK